MLTFTEVVLIQYFSGHRVNLEDSIHELSPGRNDPKVARIIAPEWIFQHKNQPIRIFSLTLIRSLINRT